MTFRFKVGDRVKIVGGAGHEGEEGVVRFVDADDPVVPYHVTLDSGAQRWRQEQHIEAVAVKPGKAGLPTDSAERKNLPVFQVLFGYFPNALLEVVKLSKSGNDKHNPGEPIHWAFDKSNDHADCIVRHQMDYDQPDEGGQLHAVNVAWRALAQLETLLIEQGAKPGRNVVFDSEPQR